MALLLIVSNTQQQFAAAVYLCFSYGSCPCLHCTIYDVYSLALLLIPKRTEPSFFFSPRIAFSHLSPLASRIANANANASGHNEQQRSNDQRPENDPAAVHQQRGRRQVPQRCNRVRLPWVHHCLIFDHVFFCTKYIFIPWTHYLVPGTK